MIKNMVLVLFNGVYNFIKLRQLMGKNILGIGIRENNMELENILMDNKLKKDYGVKERE